MAATLVLAHSPLLGPSVWRPLADTALAQGIVVVLPDLTGVVDAPRPQWRSLVETLCDVTTDLTDVVLVGHSGAGAILPAISHHLGDRARAVVFVDALVPPLAGEHHTPERLLRFLDDVTVDGRLLPWLDWWPPKTVNDMVDSAQLITELRSDMPRLLRSFYDDPIPIPDGWSHSHCAYLQLSPGYSDAQQAAKGLRWPTAIIDGTHLSILTDPAGVLDAVQGLAQQVGARLR